MKKIQTRRDFLIKSLASSALVGLGGNILFNQSSALAQSSFFPEFDPNAPEVLEATKRVEEYIKSLTTVEGRFIQANPNGSFLEGNMYLSRPGKMRFEYDEPTPIMLIANGVFFIHIDKALKNTTHIPLGSTPASFFLSNKLSMSDGLTVSGYESIHGILRIEMFQTEEPDLGRIMMAFTEDPFELKQWTVIDSQQNRTTVTLVAPRFGTELDPQLFKFKDPWRKAPER